jgi:hypothetical protein
MNRAYDEVIEFLAGGMTAQELVPADEALVRLFNPRIDHSRRLHSAPDSSSFLAGGPGAVTSGMWMSRPLHSHFADTAARPTPRTTPGGHEPASLYLG